MKALVIDAETWPDDANANLFFLKRDVSQLINESIDYEKTMWERIEMELEQVGVDSLGFEQSICSGVLDIRSEPCTKMSGSFCDGFKERLQKYRLDQNDIIMDICKEFIHNEK